MQNVDPQSLLAEFGRSFNLPSLAFDADGYCALGFDDINVLIQHQPEAGELLLSGSIGLLPGSADAEFYLRLLELNYARAIHQPGTLGVDRTAGTIMYLERWPLAGLSQERFQQRLRSLLDGFKTWRELLKAAEAGAKSGARPSLDVSFETVIRV